MVMGVLFTHPPKEGHIGDGVELFRCWFSRVSNPDTTLWVRDVHRFVGQVVPVVVFGKR